MLTRREMLSMPAAAAAALAQGKTEGALMSRVVVEVYSDFQCPACKALHEATVKPLRDEYVASGGGVRLVHREFPLPIHAHAREAALLACAADQLGLYGRVSDALFGDQAAWAASGRLDAALAKALAPAEIAKLRALAQAPAAAARVDADLALGRKIPIDQTPTMMVAHRGRAQPLKGQISYSIFKRYVDSLLAEK